MKMRWLLVLSVGVAIGSATLAVETLAADWPQWRGPDRSGVSTETGLLKAWPKDGPKLLWTFKNAGLGFSGPAIVGNRLYTLGVRDEQTFVIAVDVTGGKEIWSTKIGPLFTFKGNSWGDGPRSTPTTDGDHLYALDATGILVCLETAKGKEIWRKDLIKDLGGEMMSEWGYSESPLVDGERLICTPGGDKGTLAALDKKTGEAKWRSTALKNKAPYSSVVISEAGGIRQYIQTSYINDEEGGMVSGFAAQDGRLLWSESTFKASKSYAIAPTPIVRKNLVYVTSNMNGPSCHLFELTAKGNGIAAKDLYPKKNHKKLKNDHGGVVLVGDHVYGHSGGQGWVCQDFKTGNVAWLDRTQLECRSGSIVAAAGRLYLFSDTGTAVLLEADPEKWQESGRFELPEKSTGNKGRPTGHDAAIWTPPVVANGRLYLRDQELLFCYDVRGKQ
jgi:outer membrane protein assembly factor BamB